MTDTPSRDEREEENLPRTIVEVFLLAMLVIALSILIPALTGWDPPGYVTGIAGAVIFGVVGGMLSRRKHERPYEAQLEELRRQAAESEAGAGSASK